MFIPKHPIYQALFQLAHSYAPTSLNVLILGETGTGKEEMAKYIHDGSGRTGAFIAIDCTTLNPALIEAELFGHNKGAFTDAYDDRPGKVEMAHHGTLFLDEIGNMPLAFQVKLLRVLETKTVSRVGSSAAQAVDFRLICATNEPLKDAISKNQFRSDLYYRINHAELHMPALRDVPESLPGWIHYFLDTHMQDYPGLKDVDPHFLRDLYAHSWPGNIRELRNEVRRILISAQSKTVEPNTPKSQTLTAQLQEKEKEIITNTLHETNFNISKTATLLGLKRTTLLFRMKKLELTTTGKPNQNHLFLENKLQNISQNDFWEWNLSQKWAQEETNTEILSLLNDTKKLQEAHQFDAVQTLGLRIFTSIEHPFDISENFESILTQLAKLLSDLCNETFPDMTKTPSKNAWIALNTCLVFGTHNKKTPEQLVVSYLIVLHIVRLCLDPDTACPHLYFLGIAWTSAIVEDYSAGFTFSRNANTIFGNQVDDMRHLFNALFAKIPESTIDKLSPSFFSAAHHTGIASKNYYLASKSVLKEIEASFLTGVPAAELLKLCKYALRFTKLHYVFSIANTIENIIMAIENLIGKEGIYYTSLDTFIDKLQSHPKGFHDGLTWTLVLSFLMLEKQFEKTKTILHFLENAPYYPKGGSQWPCQLLFGKIATQHMSKTRPSISEELPAFVQNIAICSHTQTEISASAQDYLRQWGIPLPK